MDPTLTPFEELGREVARAQDEALAQPEALAAARQGFLAAAQASSQRTARRPWLLFAATATAAALGAFLVVVLWPRPIDVQVGAAGRWLAKESYVAAAGPTDLPLSFSDGSRLELRAGARARIEQRSRRGAVVVLEHGRMAAAVVHRGNSDWRMRAGPFEVRVTGTRFDLEWDAEKGVLVLTHLEGAVVVTGCQPTESLGLTTGQVLRASCANGRLQLSSSPPVPKLLPVPLPAPVVEVEALAPLAPLVPVTEPVHKTPPTAQPPPPLPEPIVAARPAAPSQPGWKELVRENRFAEAWIAAEENGLAKESEKASATDLLQLADCARFAVDPPIAAMYTVPSSIGTMARISGRLAS